MEEKAPFRPSRAHAPVSESVSESGSNKDSERADTPIPLIRENADTDFDSETHTYARLISEYWGVQDPEDAILNFGLWRVKRIHHKLKRMARKQQLGHVANYGGYFIRCLVDLRDGASATVEDDADERIAEYVERQRQRGQE